jgi:hypothetical protein
VGDHRGFSPFQPGYRSQDEAARDERKHAGAPWRSGPEAEERDAVAEFRTKPGPCVTAFLIIFLSS